jgi:hypothetical protein
MTQKRLQCKRLTADSERPEWRRVPDWRIKGRVCIVIATFREAIEQVAKFLAGEWRWRPMR